MFCSHLCHVAILGNLIDPMAPIRVSAKGEVVTAYAYYDTKKKLRTL